MAEATVKRINIEITTNGVSAARQLDRFNKSLRGLKGSTAISTRSTQISTGAFTKLGATLTGVAAGVYATQRAFDVLGMGFNATLGQYSDLIEAQNLFTVAMKDNIGAANEFVDKLATGLGVDPKDLMQYSGVFYQITTSMGIAEDKALKMSKGLTQLAYDFASLRNLKVEDVFTKLKGAIVGEARAMRELGVDITQAALQEYAHKIGIDKKVKSMTQMEKAQLRYLVIMAHSTDAQGDMARTLQQPANMIRVFGAQLRLAARSLGSLFIPILQKSLPYLIYFAYYVRKGFDAIAALFGIEMPPIIMPTTDDFADLGAGADDISSGLGSAADNAKKLRDYTLGIDELNILPPDIPTGVGGGGGGGGGGEGGLDIPIPDPYDMFADFLDPFSSLIDDIQNRLQPLINALRPFYETWVENLTNLWAVLEPVFQRIWTLLGTLWNGYVKPILGALAEYWDLQWDIIVGVLSVAWNLVEPIFDFWIAVLQRVAPYFKDFFDMFANTLDSGDVTGVFDRINEAIDGAQEWWATKIQLAIDAVKRVWDGFILPAVEFVVEFIANGWESLKTAWNTFAGWANAAKNATVSFIASGWGALQTAWTTVSGWGSIAKTATVAFVTSGWENVKTVWDSVGTWDSRSVMLTLTGKLTDSFKSAQTAWNRIKSKTVSLGVTIKTGAISAITRLVKAFNVLAAAIANKLKVVLPVFKAPDKAYGIPHRTKYVDWLAQGGMPTAGSMFVAGEAGAELIGSFGGNRNTVMPLENSGFVTAMAKAVYSAVSTAMNEAESGGSGDVYLDGAKVGTIIREGERKSGVRTSLVRSV